jgi:hypothetical protein
MYLKRRLEEAEAEKQYIFEKIKLQDNQRPLAPGTAALPEWASRVTHHR